MAFVCHFPRDADEFDQFSDELVNHTHKEIISFLVLL